MDIITLVMCIYMTGCISQSVVKNNEKHEDANAVKQGCKSADDHDIEWKQIMNDDVMQLSRMVWARSFNRRDMYAICSLIVTGEVEQLDDVAYAALLGQWIGWNPDRFDEKDREMAVLALKVLLNNAPIQSGDWYQIRDVLFLVIPESEWNDYSVESK